MKQILTILIIIFVNLSGFSQTIVDFFETIPDSSILSLTKERRKEIIKYSLDNKSQEDTYKDLIDNQDYVFDILDINNGYLRLVGHFEGHIQMCYWNLKNGNKLIAIYSEGCGPICDMDQFDFYEYNGTNFEPINWCLIIPEIYNDFLGDNYKTKMEELKNKDISATLLFDLPRNGKNIVAKWGNEDSQETYKKYGVGDRMNLIWNDGKFNKGEIYWK